MTVRILGYQDVLVLVANHFYLDMCRLVMALTYCCHIRSSFFCKCLLSLRGVHKLDSRGTTKRGRATVCVDISVAGRRAVFGCSRGVTGKVRSDGTVGGYIVVARYERDEARCAQAVARKARLDFGEPHWEAWPAKSAHDNPDIVLLLLGRETNAVQSGRGDVPTRRTRTGWKRNAGVVGLQTLTHVCSPQ